MKVELLEHGQVLQELQAQARKQLGELVILPTVDSTNDYLLKLAPTQQVIGCFAEQQTAGKGQRGKHWLSPPTGQIYFSLLWPWYQATQQMMGLSLAVAVTVVRALHHYGVGAGLKVKWPNDVYFHGEKLVGILVETASGLQGMVNIVIGIGINLYLTNEQAAAIGQPWTSLHKILQQPIARNRIAGILLNELLLAMEEFSAQGLAVFQAEWRSLDYLYGKRVTLTSPQQTLTGTMQGISATGELLLTDDQQQSHSCLTGTVRLAAF